MKRQLALIESTVAEVRARGEGNGITVAWWAEAILYNGIGDYSKALDAAERAADFPLGTGIVELGTTWNSSRRRPEAEPPTRQPMLVARLAETDHRERD